jgi:hypothetical protein
MALHNHTQTRVMVSIDDDHLSNMPAMVRRLEDAGLEVDQADDFGIVTGSIDSSDKIDSLQQVDGVSHVAPQREFQLPPRGSKVQ